ncbi:cytidylyltransferase domain-containing protein [Pusillimonas minor]|uniref:Acylneuraminate cytidylyltransferase family protein n=1 Tax=Pusillimonas minor TaxID=2697024 RepID=A0A842HSF1_9BURK|nr:acylneuraminate cytidylyltransferase family protein [Pusillimonas minor]MBC2770582.1 acylneuraminate cytidylyltransferase family protein [Pusillimonas minor]
MKRLAIIPARGGSKRIPNKNIRDFCGQPMITHVLGVARASGLFAKVHVSTESESIRDVAAQFGFPPDFPRPAELADDHTPIMPVLRHAAQEYAKRGERFDEVWLLMACAPLIHAKDLSSAASLFQQAGSEQPLLAVSEYPAPIEWAFSRGENGALTPVQAGMFAVRSQDLEKRYFDAGSFAVFPASRVLESQGAGSDSGFIGYVLPKGTAIDIDDEQDWQLAEAIYRVKAARAAA